MNGVYKKEKQELLRKAEELDKQLLREEEIKWFQRVKTTKILKGDNNTKYLHMAANEKMRKTRIFRLEQDEGVIEGDELIKSYTTKIYKNLFGSSEAGRLSLNESLVEDIPQVTNIESEMLVAEFSKKEIREAIFQMKHNKAPRPDGFPAEFYHVFWSLIKDDLMTSIHEIYLFFVSILEQLHYFQRRRRSREFSNIGPSVCFMLALRSLQRSWQIDLRR
jgi:hypothetical protein